MLLITDDAVDQVSAGVLSAPAERGGALMGLPGRPVVTEFILDVDALATPSSYQASPTLRDLIHQSERQGLLADGCVR